MPHSTPTPIRTSILYSTPVRSTRPQRGARRLRAQLGPAGLTLAVVALLSVVRPAEPDPAPRLRPVPMAAEAPAFPVAGGGTAASSPADRAVQPDDPADRFEFAFDGQFGAVAPFAGPAAEPVETPPAGRHGRALTDGRTPLRI